MVAWCWGPASAPLQPITPPAEYTHLLTTLTGKYSFPFPVHPHIPKPLNPPCKAGPIRVGAESTDADAGYGRCIIYDYARGEGGGVGTHSRHRRLGDVGGACSCSCPRRWGSRSRGRPGGGAVSSRGGGGGARRGQSYLRCVEKNRVLRVSALSWVCMSVVGVRLAECHAPLPYLIAPQ